MKNPVTPAALSLCKSESSEQTAQFVEAYGLIRAASQKLSKKFAVACHALKLFLPTATEASLAALRDFIKQVRVRVTEVENRFTYLLNLCLKDPLGKAWYR